MEITYHRLKYSALFYVLLAFGIFLVVAVYSARMTFDYPSYDDGRADQRKATLAKVQHDENALLYPVDDKGNPTATWVDQDKGFIQISIDEAMSHEVVDLQKATLGAGAAIPGTTPAPPPPPPAAPSTNAAPAAPAAPAAQGKPAAPAKPKKKKAAKTAPATTGMILTPALINVPVFNVRNGKAAPGTTFQGFITYGAPIDPSTGNIVTQASTTGTN